MPIKMTSVKNPAAAAAGRGPGHRAVTGILSAIALATAVTFAAGTPVAAAGPATAGSTSTAGGSSDPSGLGLLHLLPHPLCWLCMD